MNEVLTPQELSMFQHFPEEDLIELAVELDVPVPEVIDRAQLLNEAVVRIAQRARAEGLPFSKYDREDLAALPAAHLAAVAALCGFPAGIDEIVKAGEKVHKMYARQRPRSQVAMMLPMLLAPLARHAADTESA